MYIIFQETQGWYGCPNNKQAGPWQTRSSINRKVDGLIPGCSSLLQHPCAKYWNWWNCWSVDDDAEDLFPKVIKVGTRDSEQNYGWGPKSPRLFLWVKEVRLILKGQGIEGFLKRRILCVMHEFIKSQRRFIKVRRIGCQSLLHVKSLSRTLLEIPNRKPIALVQLGGLMWIGVNGKLICYFNESSLGAVVCAEVIF